MKPKSRVRRLKKIYSDDPRRRAWKGKSTDKPTSTFSWAGLWIPSNHTRLRCVWGNSEGDRERWKHESEFLARKRILRASIKFRARTLRWNVLHGKPRKLSLHHNYVRAELSLARIHWSWYILFMTVESITEIKTCGRLVGRKKKSEISWVGVALCSHCVRLSHFVCGKRVSHFSKHIAYQIATPISDSN